MAHKKVYGICENKCMVEVLPKSKLFLTINLDELFTLCSNTPNEYNIRAINAVGTNKKYISISYPDFISFPKLKITSNQNFNGELRIFGIPSNISTMNYTIKSFYDDEEPDTTNLSVQRNMNGMTLNVNPTLSGLKFIVLDSYTFN